ncbi:TetR family transcriptional regulator [Streptomyces sp. SID8379]|uniref:TetR/AcrR family transcriptional regulator n=1 Tax=unclassified Streptomyces TaxID=2593676 RepID=UPI00036D042E|nr:MULTISPECIES: TetR/AcrR family transcriptional regulator [unclassified Streptomyces]MYW69861.1 TetR family transcriptional regulator [Streptomyces sp. SID8379]
MTTKTARPARRPRDRKAQILAAAMECFRRSGYQATGMEDIAAAVGITAGALYRHFRSKQELLNRALLDSAEQVQAVAQNADGLDAALADLSSFTLDHRAYASVWDRETRNLAPDDRAKATGSHAAIAETLASALGTERPELAADDALLLAWAAVTTIAGASYHHVELPRPGFEELLAATARAACDTALPDAPADATAAAGLPAPGSGLRPVSRREALISTAIPLFAARGYLAVSMEDLGAAAGVSRPAVYTHFSGKADLLAAALHRESEAKWAGLARDLRRSTDASEALDRLLDSYARASVANRGAAGLVLVGDIAHLSEADQEALHRSQVDYVSEWVALLTTARPELGASEARVVVQSAFTMLNILPRLTLLERFTDPVTRLASIARSVLGVASP